MNPYLLPLLCWILLTFDLSAQRVPDSYLEQWIDIRPFREKNFQLTVAAKVKGYENETNAHLLSWQKKENGGWGTTKSRAIQSEKWAKHSISGKIDKEADSMRLAIRFQFGEQFLFDDCRLRVELSPGQWEELPVKNPGFENWSDKGRLLHWGDKIHNFKNFKSSPFTEEAYEGRYALLIRFEDYAAHNIHSSSMIPSNLAFDQVFNEKINLQQIIIAIIQDQKGFIWIGTRDGLARYDGYNFRYYRNDRSDSLSLSDNFVTSLYEDKTGGLWIGTLSGGLNFFDPETEQFRRFQNNPDDPTSISHNYVFTIYQDFYETIWVGTRGNGLNRLNSNGEQFKRFEYDENDPFNVGSYWVRNIFEDKDSNLWITAYGIGLARFDAEKEQFHHYFSTNPSSSGSMYIMDAHVDQKGMFWLGTERGLFRFDPVTGEFADLFLQEGPQVPNSYPNGIMSIVEEPSGNYWLGWSKGISLFYPNRQQFVRFDYDEDDPFDHTEGLSQLFYDQEDLLWIAKGSVISIKNPYIAPFIPWIKKGSDKKIIWPVVEDNEGYLWAVGNKGISQINLETGIVKNYIHDINDTNSIIANDALTLFDRGEDKLWIAIADHGIDELDSKTGQFRHLGRMSSGALRYINTFFQDRNDQVWLATWQGLLQLESETENFRYIPQKSDDDKNYGSDNVLCLYEDHSGYLWLGMSNGLLKRYDAKTGLFRAYNPNPGVPWVQFSNYGINSIQESQDGVLWLGTLNNGLRRFEVESGSFTSFTEREGLAGDAIQGISMDDRGMLWISTDEGLSRLDPETLMFRNYGVGDGLPAGRISKLFKSNHSGIFYFGSSEGLHRFHPDSIMENPHPPPVVITALFRHNKNEAEGQAIPVKGISSKDQIVLSYRNDILTFEFAALSYSKTVKNQYAYKMDGLTDRWINLGTRREVTFTNLAPGTYNLYIKASNGDGIWNEKGTALQIVITPPWYWSWWTKMMYIILLFVLLLGVYNFQLNRKLAAAEVLRLRELDQVKTQLYTNISHEFRTPLTVILGLSDQLKEKVNKKEKQLLHLIWRNGKNLLRLVNQMLDLRKLESGSIKANYVQDDIVNYLNYTIESFHSLAQNRGIDLKFESDIAAFYMDFDPEKLLQIMSNLLSNAIKFTPPGGKVIVKALNNPVFEKGQYFCIQVKDNGVGIPQHKLPFLFDRFYQVEEMSSGKIEGTGIGLAVTKELVKLLGGHINVNSKPSIGTTFEVRLPISQVVEKTALEPSRSVVIETTSDQIATPVTKESKSNPLVLLVEDNPDVVKYLVSCLNEDYQLEVAYDGQDGMDRAINLTPDIIISDVMMPKKNGFELAKILKNDERCSHIPIILLTAKADMESRIEGLEQGADAYLTKPFHKAELLVRIRKLLELRKNLQAYYLSFATDKGIKEKSIDTFAEITTEHLFVKKVRAAIEENLGDYKLNVDKLCKMMAMSQSQLNRKLNALTGYSANKFIRIIRLQKASKLLRETEDTISSIAYDTGFNDPDYFSRLFRREFKQTPSTFRKQKS